MVSCVCIDAKNKPANIPTTKWLKEGQKYTIMHVYLMVNQDKIQGCSLKELKIDFPPYNCFRLNRFGFKKEDVPALIELIKNCNDLNDIDVEKLLEESLLEIA